MSTADVRSHPRWRSPTILAALALAACTGDRYAGIDLQGGNGNLELQSLARAARTGDKQAQLQLGDRFAQGNGVPRNLACARSLYEDASNSTGGTSWIYSPPVGKEGRGRVIPVTTPFSPGLSEAVERLKRLGSSKVAGKEVGKAACGR
jgi:hypothetical protein